MDAALKRHPLLVTALAPLIPQLLGSAFNIWYNSVVVDPLLVAAGLKERFVATVIFWNAIAYPAAFAIWISLIRSVRPTFDRFVRGEKVDASNLEAIRRRVVHLPWYGATISGAAWFLGAIVFLVSLSLTGRPMIAQILWHFPISFGVSGFIAITQSFFVIEWAAQRGLLAVLLQGVRPDRLKGIHPISLRTRGLMWAISASICPIASLLLLIFAPASPGINPKLFGLFVGAIGIAFALFSALLIGRSVAEPVNQLREAAQAVTDGNLDVEVPVRRADEFGSLIGEFNAMVQGLREKEQLRQTFGAHVGRKAAEEILSRDPGLGGSEQEITVMFVDIRSFTARAAHLSPTKAVGLLNEFLRAMVETVEGEHSGMINKFLGDGFMALFGIGRNSRNHADQALGAACSIQRTMERFNSALAARGEEAIQIGIGINTGPAIVGSIGSPERMEFTVIGNTVNVASRIEALNKMLGTSLLISKATRDALNRVASLRALPPQMVKGVEQAVEIFTVAS
ncbi:MAG TPA: adenylate/guanylate cyclase domain-containing protein [Chthoniobacterales bacterium]|nr:adenylate/guanylate cyclase domain-containing protein [Chthoniobacterales bacterium]